MSGGGDRVRLEVAHHGVQRREPRRHGAIEFPQHDGAAIAEHDLARRHPVGAEIDEGADRAVAADDALDDRLVQPVLQREHVAVLRQMRRERAGRRLGVLRLHRQEDALPGAGEFVRREGRRGDGEFLDRAGDAQAARRGSPRHARAPHRRSDVVARALQPRADRAADRARAPDQDAVMCLAHARQARAAREDGQPAPGTTGCGTNRSHR